MISLVQVKMFKMTMYMTTTWDRNFSNCGTSLPQHAILLFWLPFSQCTHAIGATTHMQAGQGLGHRPAVDASQVRRDSFNTDYGRHCQWTVRVLKGKNRRVLRAVTRDYH